MKQLLLSLALIGLCSSIAHAQTLRLTPDKSELLHLQHDASSIIIGNPAHLSILAENPRLLVLIPKQPGATHFSILDAKGNTILEEHVIIAAPKENYVRVRRSCDGQDSDTCQKTSVFYCPDMCHSIKIAQEQAADTATAASSPIAQPGAEDYQPPLPESDPDTE